MSDFLHDDDRRESDRLRAEDRMRELNDLRAEVRRLLVG